MSRLIEELFSKLIYTLKASQLAELEIFFKDKTKLVPTAISSHIGQKFVHLFTNTVKRIGFL